jgi:glycosyltransferase involved in cell wall biosynthesis
MRSRDGAVSVLVPTYHRPDYLQRCVEAIRGQSLAADQIIVVRRNDDAETAAAMDKIRVDDLDDVVITDLGVVAALGAGVPAASGEIIAFIDDDAVPHSDWLERLVSHFDEPAVGGAGGRDIVQDEAHAKLPLTTEVGLVGHWGKLRGNHHIGSGPPRDVMVLKGVNMAFRRQAIALPEGLKGEGAQVHWELAVCLWALKRGWRLVYDPTAIVDHFIGPRFGADSRRRLAGTATRDAAYNLVACLLAANRDLLWRRATFGFLVGDRGTPGLLRAAAAVLDRDWEVLRRLPLSLYGQGSAFVDVTRGKGVRMAVFSE